MALHLSMVLDTLTARSISPASLLYNLFNDMRKGESHLQPKFGFFGDKQHGQAFTGGKGKDKLFCLVVILHGEFDVELTGTLLDLFVDPACEFR
jgi:hypothetical protein